MSLMRDGFASPASASEDLARYDRDEADLGERVQALEKELAQNQKQMKSMNSQILNLVANLMEKETRKLEVDPTTRSASGQASSQSTRVDEMAQGYGKVPEIEKEPNDLVATMEKGKPTGAAGGADAAQADLPEKRVVGLESQMSDVMQTHKGLDNNFATNISDTKVEELTTRVMTLEEANKLQDAHLKRVDGTLTELFNHRQRVDADLDQLNIEWDSYRVDHR